jgi:hypothetical protein
MRLGIVVFMALLGCSASDPPDRAGERTAPEIPASIADPISPPAQPVPTDRRHDLDGIVVTYLADGRITIAGTNRWGRPLDTTYASERYFRDAITVLERSVSPEQAVALQALVAGSEP